VRLASSAVSAQPEQLAEGLWRWTTRHPEWHPGEFGREVACYALRAPHALLLVDPLLPEKDDGAVVDTLDEAAGDEPVAILITIPYHARSAEALSERYRSQGASIHGDELAFGDCVVEEGGRLRVWSEPRVDDRVRRFHAERFNPTLRPLLELGAERVLVTHGAPVLSGGTRALAEALDADPWYHRPS